MQATVVVREEISFKRTYKKLKLQTKKKMNGFRLNKGLLKRKETKGGWNCYGGIKNEVA